MNVTNLVRTIPTTRLIRPIPDEPTFLVRPASAVTKLLLNRHPVVFVGGGDGPVGQADSFTVVAAASFSAGRLVAQVGGELVYYDAANVTHLFALVGVTINAANPGEPLQIRTGGSIRIPGWGLAIDQIYQAGLAGQLVGHLPAQAQFSHLIGRATDSDTLLFSPQNLYKNG